MLQDRQIKPPPEQCKVFGEWLVYLFYGRPAYKVHIDYPEQRLTDEYLPVAMVLDPGCVAAVRRAFPFDSGAFHGGAYSGVLHKHARLTDFELEPSVESARKVVGAFFGSNENYLLGQASVGRLPDAFDDPEANAHRALITGGTEVDVDDRRYTIEIQTEEAITLAPFLRAVVMPHTWLKSESVQAFLRDFPTVEPLTYARYHGASITAAHAVIFERIYDYLSENDLLPEDPK